MSLRLAQLVPSIVCPACHTPNDASARWLASANRYVAQIDVLRDVVVHGEKSRVLVELSDRANLHEWSNTWAVVLALVFSVVFVGFVSLSPDASILVFVIIAGTPVCFLVCGLPYIYAKLAPARVARWRYRWGAGRRLRASRIEPPPKHVRCPSCGAQAEVAAGAVVDVCRYCRASLAAAVHELWRASWSFATAERARIMVYPPPSRFFRELETFAKASGYGTLPDPWHQLPTLAHWLGGHCGMRNLSWWMRGFWPESLPESFFHHLGGFVCGSARGYPVAIFVSKTREPAYYSNPGARLWLTVFVGAVVLAVDRRIESELSYYRTTAGYMQTVRLSWTDATAERLWWYVDRLAAQAEQDGAPPAPCVHPNMLTGAPAGAR
jgi:hypothetical protein